MTSGLIARSARLLSIDKLLAESVGQRLLGISTTLSPFRVAICTTKARPITIVLYKYPAVRCKNNHERSTDPH
ncbi:hypothetical protein Q4519_18390 [Motilimonas sp. 1_MG-2023]|nr:hypothetical protein [Motilimonas sp. 1_MG-2023]MDO6527649.1 hypothetical protein [Motilimonas sp. 1_MG-2023]